jgi:hypothetical protein
MVTADVSSISDEDLAAMIAGDDADLKEALLRRLRGERATNTQIGPRHM